MTLVEPDRAVRTMLPLESAVHAAVASIDDPEYPGISIVDLGLLESIEIGADASVHIGLIPTFAGCPALAVIGDEVAAAVGAVDRVTGCSIEWLVAPVWHADRITHEARACLESKYTVTVQIGTRPAMCPSCASKTVEESPEGPVRCRSIHVCTGCGSTVEVVRG